MEGIEGQRPFGLSKRKGRAEARLNLINNTVIIRCIIGK